MKVAVWIFLFLPSFLQANDTVLAEQIKNAFKFELIEQSLASVCSFAESDDCEWNKKLLVDAFIEVLDENELNDIDVALLLQQIDYASLTAADQIRLKFYLQSFGFSGVRTYLQATKEFETKRDHLTACVYLNYRCKPHQQSLAASPTKAMLEDLLVRTPIADSYRDGRYKNSPKLFMLCRQNRKYPCLMLMKDKTGTFVTKDNGEIWSMPVLGLSRKGRKATKSDGHTPAGIHSIDSVMPEANKRFTFGKFRRLILNFIRPSNEEAFHKSLLPATSHTSAWWRDAVIARDVGRLYLRIHGTGKRNANTRSTYYPHIATRGCVSTLEGSYDGIRYTDQKYLLDVMMLASGLEPTFNNHTRLKGLLYVVNIDNKKQAVSLDDIHSSLNRAL